MKGQFLRLYLRRECASLALEINRAALAEKRGAEFLLIPDEKIPYGPVTDCTLTGSSG